MSIRRRLAMTYRKVNAAERGMALLVVLWIIASAALLISAFNAAVRSGLSFVGSEVQEARLEALLDAGTEIAAARLLDDEESRRWPPDGSRHGVSFAGAEITISISDANGLVDLNRADEKLLMGLMRQFADSEAKARRLRDRIMKARASAAGKQGSVGTSSGVSGPRESAAGTEGPVNANADNVPAFVDIAQLRELEGMTPELYSVLAPFVTVYGSDGRINPQAAPDEVLAAIPALTPADIEKLRAFRAAGPKDADAALLDIAQRAGAYLADTPGPAYLVTVEVRRPGGRSAQQVSVLAPDLDEGAPYRLIAKRPIGSLKPGSRIGGSP